MSVGAMVGAWARSKPERVEVVVVEPKPVTGEEWTVAGTIQLLIANGADKKEIAEFVRKSSK